VSVQQRQQRRPIEQADLIEPGAAQRQRRVVQHDQHVAVSGLSQLLCQCRQRGRTEPAVRLTGDAAIQQHNPPAACIVLTADLKGRLLQARRQNLWQIVVARDAQHRFAQRRQQRRQMRIGGGLVLHQVAAEHDSVGCGQIGCGRTQRRSQRGQRGHTFEAALRVCQQVQIGELDELNGVGAHTHIMPCRASRAHGFAVSGREYENGRLSNLRE